MGSLVVLVTITRVCALIILSAASPNAITASIPSAQTSSNPSNAISTMAPVTERIPASQTRGVRTMSRPNAYSLDDEKSRLTLNRGLALRDASVKASSTTGGSNPNSGPAIASPNATANFEGLHTTIDCTVPPDSDGTVGPTYYVAFVNNYNNCATQTPAGNVGFFDKSNGTLAAAFYYPSLFTGFSTGCNDPTQHTDPQVVYDSGEDHYLFTTITTTAPYQMCVASTLSNDPINGAYCVASYATQGGNIADYEKAGVWIDGLYVTYNPGTSDSRTVVLNKSDLETCTNTIRLQDFDMGRDTRENDNFCTPQPNHIFRPVPATYNIFTGGVPTAGEPEFLVSSFCQSSHVYVYTLHVDWANSANSVLTRATIAVQATHFAPNTVSSPGNPIDTLNTHLMTPANYIKDTNGNEYLWTTMTVCNGTSCSSSSGTSAIAWYQLKLVNGNAAGTTVKNQNIWNPDSTSRLQAAGAFDRQGNALMDYTQVSSPQNPAVAYAGRLASDPANTLNQTETILYRGASTGSGACSTQNPCVRWGDYSANFIDPDGCAFWFTHEYYMTSNPWQWDTRIGAVRYPSCTPMTYGRTVAPGSLSFTSTAIGVTSTIKSVSVTNTGTGPLVVQPANITGTNASDFTIVSNNCSIPSTGIAGSASCAVQVSCTPSGAGIRTATLDIRTNVAAADSTRIALSCSAGTPTSTMLACLPTVVAIGHNTICTATVNDTSSGPTPAGTVSFTSSVATSSFGPANCVLNGTSTFATCSVSYAQTSSTTTPTIAANYGGDAGHLTSSGTTTVTVFLEGDVNGDCKVDIVDLANVGAAFGSTPASPNWNQAADLNHDGKVDIVDLVIVASNFGFTC